MAEEYFFGNNRIIERWFGNNKLYEYELTEPPVETDVKFTFGFSLDSSCGYMNIPEYSSEHIGSLSNGNFMFEDFELVAIDVVQDVFSGMGIDYVEYYFKGDSNKADTVYDGLFGKMLTLNNGETEINLDLGAYDAENIDVENNVIGFMKIIDQTIVQFFVYSADLGLEVIAIFK